MGSFDGELAPKPEQGLVVADTKSPCEGRIDWSLEQDVPLGAAAVAPMDSYAQLLTQLSDVDGQLDFVESRLGAAGFEPERRRAMEEGIARVRARQADHMLYMAVVGEFSAGKSSFVNALLGEELLETDAVQGTTVAATIIRHSPERSLWAHRTDDLSRGVRLDAPGDAGGLSATLAEVASQDRFSREHELRLGVTHPAEFLARGVAIIDTPGIGSLTDWHEGVTCDAIHELADACIVVVPAPQAFSESLVRFLQRDLADVLPSCVFVLSYMDLVRPSERARVLSWARRTVDLKLGVPGAPIVPWCSLLEGPEAKAWAESNAEAERTIVEHLCRRRTQAQLARCMGLLEEVMGALGEGVAQLRERREHERAELARMPAGTLADFVASGRSALRLQMEHVLGECEAELRYDLECWTDETVQAVLSDLSGCAVGSTVLNRFVHLGDTLRETLPEGLLQHVGVCDAKLAFPWSEVDEALHTRCAAFRDDFCVAYPALVAAESGDGAVPSVPPVLEGAGGLAEGLSAALAAVDPATVPSWASFSQEATSRDNHDTVSFFGKWGAKAAAGAAVGSVVPGIGTVAGGVLGGVVGFLTCNDSDEREQTKVDEQFRALGPGAAAVTREYAAALGEVLLANLHDFAEARLEVAEAYVLSFEERYAAVERELREADLAAERAAAVEVARLEGEAALVEDRLRLVRLTRERVSRL